MTTTSRGSNDRSFTRALLRRHRVRRNYSAQPLEIFLRTGDSRLALAGQDLSAFCARLGCELSVDDYERAGLPSLATLDAHELANAVFTLASTCGSILRM